MKIHIKICGITTIEDARQAAYAGADYIGIIVGITGSPRSVSVAQAARIRAASDVPVIILSDMPLAQLCDVLAIIQPDGVQRVGRFMQEDLRAIKQTALCAVWQTLYIPPENAEQNVDSVGAAAALSALPGADVLVCDTGIPGKKGGTGIIGNWHIARALVQRSTIPVFLAGGITPDNVCDALALVQPFGIDVSSGVEQKPGIKDVKKIHQLIHAVRTFDASAHSCCTQV